nr:hypothetical protein Iba_chr06bCG11170 [Ipomoea batatas]GMD09090.1 hypothetical protein Iba_chr06dCG4790 [Ipomoea batatas]
MRRIAMENEAIIRGARGGGQEKITVKMKMSRFIGRPPPPLAVHSQPSTAVYSQPSPSLTVSTASLQPSTVSPSTAAPRHPQTVSTASPPPPSTASPRRRRQCHPPQPASALRLGYYIYGKF